MIRGLFEKKMANRTRIGFLFAFVLLLIGNILSFISTEKVSEQSESVNHTNLIIEGLESILNYTTRAESEFRGYLLDGNDLHYEGFKKSIRKADSTIDVVNRLTKTNHFQKVNVESISSQVNVIINLLEENFQRFREDRAVTAEIRDGTVRVSRLKLALEMDVYQMQTEEKKLWEARSENISEYINIIKFISIISTLVAILLTIYSIVVFNKENNAKKEADRQAGLFREQLERRVAQLGELNTELIELRSIEKFASTGRIARTIAHEVRNPLTNINLAVEQLKTEFEGTENADIFLDMISRNSVRINNLVSDLLNATKLTELNKVSTSVNTILEECLKDSEDRIRLNHIKVVKDFDDQICKVSVDIGKIKIAFLNLIVNGIEAMEDGGTLTISTEAIDDKCVIRISDTGCGMTREQINRLFEPFFSTKKMGNGLGLANSQNIILSHNGSIKCETEEGRGTTFTITLDFE